MNPQGTDQTYFAALDWAQEHHDVLVVDRGGTMLADFQLAHTAEGGRQFAQQMQPCGGCPISSETSCGRGVDQLVQRGFPVYPVNPKAAQRDRERKAPSGTKTDHHDVWSLAEALRTDGHAWPALPPQDETTATRRLLCRDEFVLLEQRTALVNPLQAALRDYYPLALESFDDWTKPFPWAFVRAFPTADALRQAGKRRRENVLHLHKLWRPETAPERLAAWARGPPLHASPAAVKAKSLLAVRLATVLESLQRPMDQSRRQITSRFEQHPDHDIFGSLPGSGTKLGPRLLAELGSIRDIFPDAEGLLCFAGVSPVSFQSGKIRKSPIRWACNRVLRATVHLWVDETRKTCAWAQADSQAKREAGHSHASALRCLGKRWLKLLWRLWQDRVSYPESKYLESLRQHGSFVWNQLQGQYA